MIGAFRTGYRTAVWWALGVLVVVAVGLPLTIGLATRGMADRPPKPPRPGYGKTGQWLHERYGLDWRACVRIQQSVGRGERVRDSALEDPAHGLAELIVSGRAPGQRLIRVAGLVWMGSGAAVLVVGIVVVILGHAPSRVLFFFWYGPFMMIQAGVQTIWAPRVHRRKASRALELNRQGATAQLWFGAEDHRCEAARVILVTGATGNVGAEVARALAGGGTYLDDQATGTTEDLLGRTPRTFRDWAHAHAGDFSLA